MKAVIMAGGEGTRLRPLTCNLPKPMARVFGRPVLDYIVDLLSVQGFDEAIVTLKYMPEYINDYIEDNNGSKMKLKGIVEEGALGTAGSVRNAASDFTEPFLVISGDAICDFNLRDAYNNHIENNALFTVVGTRVSDPREYGLINASKDGKILSFNEKPGWGQITTNLANTGIYIINPEVLKLIPEGEFFDFASDLFPLMLSKGMELRVYEAGGYWCDIGDVEAYKYCHFDIMSGKTGIILPYTAKGIYTREVLPEGDYTLVPPVYIGRDVTIGDKAVIGPNTVIDDGCNIGAGAEVKSSVVLNSVHIAANAYLNSSVVCEGAVIKSGARLFENTVIGANAVIGENAIIKNNVRIWPEKQVGEGAEVIDNIRDGNVTRDVFGDEGIGGITFSELSCEKAARLGCAVGSSKNGRRVCIAHDGKAASLAIEKAITAGLMSTGARVLGFGDSFVSELKFFTGYCDLKSGIFIRTENDYTEIMLFGELGLPLTRKAEREISDKYRRCDFIRCTQDSCADVVDISAIKGSYRRELEKSAFSSLGGVGAKVSSDNEKIKLVINNCLNNLKLSEKDYPVFIIDSTGTKVYAKDENGEEISYETLLCLAAYDELSQGKDIVISSEAPMVIDTLAKDFGVNVRRYISSSPEFEDEEMRATAEKNKWGYDALFLTVKILSMMKKEERSLSELIKYLPKFMIIKKAIPLNFSPSKLTEVFAKSGGAIPITADGKTIKIEAGKGRAVLAPTRTGKMLKVYSEGHDTEIAGELAFEIEKIINSANIDIK
jgi:mannose-1-phosphate guanylyltransferase/phosphomannomutase